MNDNEASKKLANLSAEEKRALLAQLLRKKAEATHTTETIGIAGTPSANGEADRQEHTNQNGHSNKSVNGHSKIQQTSPLSQNQRALWFLAQLAPESAAYNLLYSARIRVALDVPALQRAVQELVRRYPILTATYTTQDGEPVHLFHPETNISIDVVDATTWSEEQLRQRLLREGNTPFNLEHGPILRLNVFQRGARDTILSLTIHHIAADLWSLDLLIDELLALYAREQTGIQVALPAPGMPFTDYVRWQQDMLTGPEGERHWHYWQQELSGEPAILSIPTDRPRPAVQTYRGASHSFAFSDDLVQRLRALATREKVTLYTLILAAYEVLLYRYTEQDDLVIGTPTLGRSHADMERVIGYLANPVAVRTQLSGNPTFLSVLEQVRHKMMHALEHQDYPFPLLVEKLQPKRNPGYSPLIQTLFIWDRPRVREGHNPTGQNGNTLHANKETLALEPFLVGQQGAPFDLTLTIFEVEGSLTADFRYNVDLFDASTLAQMEQHFKVLLTHIVEQPAQSILDLPMLTADERQRILYEWNDTQRVFPSQTTLHTLFEQQVQRTPDATALTFENTHLTYRELNSRANSVAHRLQSLGVGPESLVGVCMERSVEMVVALLATLKAGGAYVPLEPGYPQERLDYIIEDAHLSIFLTQTRLRNLLPNGKNNTSDTYNTNDPVEVLCLDDEQLFDAFSKENPVSATQPDNLVYVIYTSGSTGRPKGVMNIHRALANRLHWMQQTYHLTPQDRVMQKTPFSFDVSVWEFFWPLLYGAHLVVARPRGHQDTSYLASLIQEQQITTMHFVPSMLRAFLMEPHLERCRSLKRVICSGEALPYDLQELFFARFNAELHNLYGPTEAAIDVTAWQCQRGSGDTSVPIGRPIANTQIYLLNRSLQPVPVGVAGELHIGGVGLARGYLNRPELTAEKFIRDLFSDDEQTRLFKSGDLARYRDDGAIEFLGRIDHQVKIRGVRIELGEVEAALIEHPDVREVVVVAREDTPGNKRLVAYLSTHETTHLSVEALRNFLKEKLPQEMIPSAFVLLERLPLLTNGKVNRNALPAPDTARPDLETVYVAPRNNTETQLAAIWLQVLGLDRIGIHDNFFDLGGASIQSLQVVAKANEVAIPLTPEMLFEYQTIAELSNALSTRQATTSKQRANQQNEAYAKREQETVNRDKMQERQSPSVQVAPAQIMPVARENTIIESIGVYLPPKVVSTKDILEQCSTPIRFPLAQLTGIKTRRMAGETEFAVDLARKAVADCLANSKYHPDDIDLVICTSISRYNGPDFHITFEPSTAVQLQHHFGFKNALAFDVSNACTGMFTGMYIVDAFLKAGLIRRGLVVSGEYITHLTKTAQQEIDDYMDSRLACLTVGDAGAAVILDRTPDTRYGFHEFEMYTVGRYYDLCIAKGSDRQNSGAIMYTDAVRVSAVNIQQAVSHAAHVIERSGWSKEAFQHIVMHQTSKMTIYDAGREINSYFGKELCNEENLINNITERGNTATTTHVVALMDQIRAGRIQSDSNVIFGITGSGVNIGTAIYTFDDLPERLRRSASGVWHPEKVARTSQAYRPLLPQTKRVRVESVGTMPLHTQGKRETLEMVRVAAEQCLANFVHPRNEIDLLLYAGVYRDEFISEPAIAAMVAGTLDINADVSSQRDKKTFSFDLFNGSVGFLNACYTSIAMMKGHGAKTAMVVASEVENNRDVLPESLRGIEETASVALLDESEGGATGFGNFVFKQYTDYLESIDTYTTHHNGRIALHIEQDARLEDYYIQCIVETLQELLRVEHLDMSQVQHVLPPQISSSFIDKLSDALDIERARCIDVRAEHDLFTSSTAYALQTVREQGKAKVGDIGLIIEVGAGIQVACATYHF